MTYAVLKLAHIIGAILIGAGLIGVWLCDMRSRQSRELIRVAEAVRNIAVFYDGVVVPGALVLLASGTWMIVEFYGGWGFIGVPWLAGMVFLFAFEFIEGNTVICAGGALYMSVPWVWRYHAYPDDYFRFSWRGIMELFPSFEWTNVCYSTNVPNEFFDIVANNPGIDNSMAAFAETPGGKRKYLPYLMVNMLGFKSAPGP